MFGTNEKSTKQAPDPPVPLILPLHGRLSITDQKKIYEEHDVNKTRLIIVSTNVAESSLTIPDVKFVIDACRAKIKVQTNIGARLAI